MRLACLLLGTLVVAVGCGGGSGGSGETGASSTPDSGSPSHAKPVALQPHDSERSFQRRCNYSFLHRFTRHGRPFRITVFRGKNTPCGIAISLVREFWSPKVRGTQVGPSFVMTRFPGWHCYQGGGGGDCHKGRQDVGYEEKPLRPPKPRKPAKPPAQRKRK